MKKWDYESAEFGSASRSFLNSSGERRKFEKGRGKQGMEMR